MPELNEYQSQVETQGPVGGISPNMEAVTAEGRGLEKLGNDISQGAQFIHQRQAQEEQADGYAQMATLREKKTVELHQGMQDGTLNADNLDKFNQSYQDEADKIGANYSTGAGKNYFERKKARDGAALTLMGATMAGQVAKNKIQDQFQQGVVSQSNIAHDNPDQFPSLIDGSKEDVAALASSPGGNSALAPKMQQHMNEKIADGAARGLAEQDPGYNPDGTPVKNKLLQMLDFKDPVTKKNAFDDYLDADKQATLRKYAVEQDAMRRTQENVSAKQQKDAYEAQAEQYKAGITDQIIAGKFNINSLHNAPLNSQDKLKVAAEADMWARKENRFDPRAANQLRDQIYSHTITNEGQLFDYAKKNNLPYSVVQESKHLLDMTPEGTRLNFDRKRIFDMLKAPGGGITFKDSSGQDSPVGQTNVHLAHDELLDLEKQYTTDKKPLNTLYDLHNPDLQNIFSKYSATRQQANGSTARQTVNDALGVKTPPPIQYSTSPNKQVPTPAAPPPPKSPYVKLPGETPAATLKRINELKAKQNGG